MLSLIFFALALMGFVGCICGATHHAMTAVVCLIFGIMFFAEERDERRGRAKR